MTVRERKADAPWITEAIAAHKNGMSLWDAVRAVDHDRKSDEAAFLAIKERIDPAYKLRRLGATVRADIGFVGGKKTPTMDLVKKFLADNPTVVEDLMSERTFKEVKKFTGSQTKTGVEISCTKRVSPDCLKTEEFYASYGRPSYVHAAQQFRNKGWRVGGGPRNDVCPKCWEALHESKPAPKVPTSDIIRNIHSNDAPVVKPKSTPAPAAKGQKMTPVDRRIITEKLDEVYFIDKGGYVAEWSDDAVAKELGCAIEWVAEVRDAFFGPETSADTFSKEVKALKDYGAEMVELKKQVENLITRIGETDELLNTKLREFETKSKEFQRRYDALYKKATG